MNLHTGDTAPSDIDPRALHVHHVRADEMDGHAAITGTTSGRSGYGWGWSKTPPASTTENHHHGDSEAGIYVVRGHPVFVRDRGRRQVGPATVPWPHQPWRIKRERRPMSNPVWPRSSVSNTATNAWRRS
jgi:hypothetical protein